MKKSKIWPYRRKLSICMLYRAARDEVHSNLQSTHPKWSQLQSIQPQLAAKIAFQTKFKLLTLSWKENRLFQQSLHKELSWQIKEWLIVLRLLRSLRRSHKLLVSCSSINLSQTPYPTLAKKKWVQAHTVCHQFLVTRPTLEVTIAK